VKLPEAFAARSDTVVRYGAIRRPAITDIVPEPISPELVLVDAELQRSILAQQVEELLLEALPGPAPHRLQTEPAPRPVEPAEPLPSPAAPMPLSVVLHGPGQLAPKPRRKRRLTPALLSVSLAVNVIVIALSVSDARVAQTSPSSPLAIDRPATSRLEPIAPTTTAQRPPVPAPRTKRRAAPWRTTVAGVTRGEAEQRVLTTVIQSPGGKLPKALIDPTTGLAKNGLQAHCRAVSRMRSFLCVVRPAQHRAGEGLYLRYQPKVKGTGNFTWYPYRSK
jgi:hypothetical protein